jgi:hypothetical protein
LFKNLYLKKTATKSIWQVAICSKRCNSLLLATSIYPSEAIYFATRKGTLGFAQAFKAKRSSIVKRKINGQVQLLTPALKIPKTLCLCENRVPEVDSLVKVPCPNTASPDWICGGHEIQSNV